MARTEPAAIWSLHYQLILSVIAEIAPEVSRLSLDPKELFVLAEIELIGDRGLNVSRSVSGAVGHQYQDRPHDRLEVWDRHRAILSDVRR